MRHPCLVGICRRIPAACIRGQAYLAQKSGPAAAAEFQKIIDRPGLVGNTVTGSLAHLQIARAYALSGDSAKAKAAYQDFFKLWKVEGGRPFSGNWISGGPSAIW
jgi:hypothetical protein